MEKYRFRQMLDPLKSMEIGKPDWLYSMSGRLQEDYYRTEKYGAGRMVDTLRDLIPHKPWNHIPLDNPSRRADVYFEGVTGKPWNVLVSIVREYDNELSLRIEAEINPGSGGDRKSNYIKHNNVITDKTTQGNKRSYTLNRLSREHPELFNEVVTGKKSANEAAIEAGFRRPQLTIKDDPESSARSIVNKFGIEYALELCDQIKQLS